ncbi:MAG: M14 family zinc carboxypeptidase [Bacteroidota bacterium]
MPGPRSMETDPCGYPDVDSPEYKIAAAQNWGYGYDSLLSDLGRWGDSPFVKTDSVGASVQNRALYMLTIQDTASQGILRERVWVHARTHPNEVQGTRVTNELIDILLSEDWLGRLLREKCVFNIIPMYNPDGVELGYGRENANGVDIESNWDKPVLEPEVQVLKGLFEKFMAEPNPIRVALNMHSASNCTRYFVYHDATGTSTFYAQLEQEYIGAVRATVAEWLEPWDFFVSWMYSAPRRYPESWFWYNHAETVMALTYEDMNCVSAHGFDTTAAALLRGSAVYLGVTGGPTGIVASGSLPVEFQLFQNYPNPFNPSTTLEYSLPRSEHTILKIYNLLGSEIATLVDEDQVAGLHRLVWNAENVPSGVYLYRIRAGEFVQSRRAVLIR